ncbi:MAG: radical SAM protein [Thermoprotei archaeon]
MNDIVVRISIGSMTELGLTSYRYRYRPETLYLLQYSEYGCIGRCRYCTQSISSSKPKKFLSRITWYPVKLGVVLDKLREKNPFKRICFQTILKQGFIEEALRVAESIRNTIGNSVGFSLASTPIHKDYLYLFRDMGVDYYGVGLDTSTPEIFKLMNKPYTWKTYIRFVEDLVEVFGWRHAIVHLIVGLGENKQELYNTMEKLVGIGANIALFPYTDPNTLKPSIDPVAYREAQIIRYLLLRGYKLREILRGNRIDREYILEIIENPEKYYEVFATSGCPHCNRPYYNESPRGPFYNMYSRKHYMEYIEEIRRELLELLRGSA